MPTEPYSAELDAAMEAGSAQDCLMQLGHIIATLKQDDTDAGTTARIQCLSDQVKAHAAKFAVAVAEQHDASDVEGEHAVGAARNGRANKGSKSGHRARA